MRYNQDLEIVDLHRQALREKGSFRWQVELPVGKIEFESSGYKQFFRSAPVFTESQSLGLETRGGVSFSRDTFSQS